MQATETESIPRTIKPETIDTDKDLRTRVLEWCNAQRFKGGLAPVDALMKGKRTCFLNCVIARTAAVHCVCGVGHKEDARFYRTRSHWKCSNSEPLPDEVRLFALGFDKGLYPDLIE